MSTVHNLPQSHTDFLAIGHAPDEQEDGWVVDRQALSQQLREDKYLSGY